MINGVIQGMANQHIHLMPEEFLVKLLQDIEREIHYWWSGER